MLNVFKVFCPICQRIFELRTDLKLCPFCGAPLFIHYEVSSTEFRKCIESSKYNYDLGIWSFKCLLPVKRCGKSLGEGWTRVIDVENIGRLYNVRIALKNESLNPTGTFIDRGAAVDVCYAFENGYSSITTASLGDFSISIATYALHYNIKTLHFIPKDIEIWKLYRLILLNSDVKYVDSYKEAVERALKRCLRGKCYTSLTSSPMIIDGYRTLVFELIEYFRKGFNWIAIPVGEGVFASAIFKGINELSEYMGLDMPKILAVRIKDFEPKELKTSYSLPSLFSELEVSGSNTLEIIKKFIEISNGFIINVDESTILRIANELARREGLVIDPIGIASLAGVIEARNNNLIDANDKVIAVVSGSPSKDPYILYKIIEVENNLLQNIGCISNEVKISAIQREIMRILYERKVLHMYGIWKELNRRGYRITLQTVYHHIKQLKNKDLIEISRNSNERTLYTLTETGFLYLSKLSS